MGCCQSLCCLGSSIHFILGPSPAHLAPPCSPTRCFLGWNSVAAWYALLGSNFTNRTGSYPNGPSFFQISHLAASGHSRLRCPGFLQPSQFLQSLRMCPHPSIRSPPSGIIAAAQSRLRFRALLPRVHPLLWTAPQVLPIPWLSPCLPTLLELALLPEPDSRSWSFSPVDCSFSRRTGLQGSSVLPSTPAVALASDMAPPTPPSVSPAVDVLPACASIRLSPSRAVPGHLPGASHPPAFPLACGGSRASAERRRTSIPATLVGAANAIPSAAVLPSTSAARATVTPRLLSPSAAADDKVSVTHPLAFLPVTVLWAASALCRRAVLHAAGIPPASAWLLPTVPLPSDVLTPPAHILRLFLREIPAPSTCWNLPRDSDAPAVARHLGGSLPLGQAVPRVAPLMPSSAPPLPPRLGRQTSIPPLPLWRDHHGPRLSCRRHIPGPRPHLLHFSLAPPPVSGRPGVILPPCRPQSLFPGRGEAPPVYANDLARRVAVPLLPASGIPQSGDGDRDRLRFRETFPSATAPR
ncbi:unnamed protein product [Closterium sp. NIES-54]